MCNTKILALVAICACGELFGASIVMKDAEAEYLSPGEAIDAQNNKVELIGGKVGRDVYGGQGRKTALFNRVFISGGSVGGDVYGGFSIDGARVERNSVEISGGEIGGNVYGGYVHNDDNTIGQAYRNSVTISGGHIRGDVYGGVVYNQMSADSNVVKLLGGVIDGFLFGGETIDKRRIASSNNELIIADRNIKAKGIMNKTFSKYEFSLPKDIKANEKMLELELHTPIHKQTQVEISLQGPLSFLGANDKVIR